MTSATYKPARSAGGGYAEGRGLGTVVFAGVLLAVIGFFNLLDGIAAIANSHIFIGNAHYVVGDLRAWGWVMTIFGAVQLLAAASMCRPRGLTLRVRSCLQVGARTGDRRD